MDGAQPARLQQGLDAQEAPCNADHQGMKNNFHVHLDPINPDFDIVPSGRPTIQCQDMADCYADVPPEERQQETRALVFDPEGRFVTSVNLTCLAELAINAISVMTDSVDRGMP